MSDNHAKTIHHPNAGGVGVRDVGVMRVITIVGGGV